MKMTVSSKLFQIVGQTIVDLSCQSAYFKQRRRGRVVEGAPLLRKNPSTNHNFYEQLWLTFQSVGATTVVSNTPTLGRMG